ncbi:hypothetical protein [Helicobacter cetorum]|uniref:hypothetical protein n=1 Tax=Helicobacter cetorum TaxID=138563 RepID=UPI000CF0FD13|nr:hypothetical protein [Helicobacter cetorum]
MFKTLFKLVSMVGITTLLLSGCGAYFGNGYGYVAKEQTKNSFSAIGKSCSWKLLGFIPISKDNTIQSAIRDALRNGGNSLQDMVVQQSLTYYLGLATQSCTIVEGNLVSKSVSK